MRYDCLIIGAGLSGLVCGIRCAGAGLRTVIISGGMNALHFSSGSIDLMGYDASGRYIPSPYDYLKGFIKKKPGHPYARVGLKTLRESMGFFKHECAAGGLSLVDNNENNHFHITGLGTVKPSFLSQQSVFNERLKNAFESREPIAVLNFEGFRDYFTELTMEQLRNLPLLKSTKITAGTIRLPYYLGTERNLHEFRSIDLARVFDSEKYLPRIADEIKKAAGGARIVSLPAFIGIENFNRIHRRLEEMRASSSTRSRPCRPPYWACASTGR
jgi:glycerol-3-phosphate dehydrogenase subunit B